LACSIRAPHAVPYCIQNAAATPNEMFSGCWARLRAGTLANSFQVDKDHKLKLEKGLQAIFIVSK